MKKKVYDTAMEMILSSPTQYTCVKSEIYSIQSKNVRNAIFQSDSNKVSLEYTSISPLYSGLSKCCWLQLKQ